MIRPMLASLAAAALALSLAASPVEARPRGGAVVAGAVIGLAAGAIIGSALAERGQRHDGYVVQPEAPAAFYRPGPYDGAGYRVQPRPYGHGYGRPWQRHGGMSPHYW